MQVSALRKVLGLLAIATVPGRRYRFVPRSRKRPLATRRGLRPPHPSRRPLRRSPLIGRDEALAALAARVLEHPLVTGTGPGDIGKRRLALAVAQAVAEHWRDGLGWIEAASVASADQQRKPWPHIERWRPEAESLGDEAAIDLMFQ